MKKILLAIAIAAMSVTAFADTMVNGYYKSNGTYVQPHMRSSPDGFSSNNWTTQGNVNPYTGSHGTRQNLDYGTNNSFGNSGSYDSGSGVNTNHLQPLNLNCGQLC